MECNDIIAEHAVAHGVSHGSVAAFITNTAPDDILWHSREDVDCLGISRYPFTDQSGFEKSEPCIFLALGWSLPPSQSAWRVDSLEDGYRAFFRPAADHLREFELSLYCDQTRPGQLFLSIDIGGRSEAISKVLTEAQLIANPILSELVAFEVVQVDTLYSRVIVEIPKVQTLDFLTKADALTLAFSVRPPYERMVANTNLAGSRKALVFAANHCLNS